MVKIKSSKLDCSKYFYLLFAYRFKKAIDITNVLFFDMNKFFKSQIRDIKIGKNCKIVEPVNLYECEIGNNVKIGPFVEITKGVKIGDNCIISSHSFICEKVTVEEDVFIGHGVMFTNDTFSNGKRAHGDKTKWKSTNIGNKVLIGSNVTILPVSICDEAVIGAGAVVTRDINVKGIYFGNPAVLFKKI